MLNNPRLDDKTLLLMAMFLLSAALFGLVNDKYSRNLKIIEETNRHVASLFREMKWAIIFGIIAGALISAVVCYFIYVWYVFG